MKKKKKKLSTPSRKAKKKSTLKDKTKKKTRKEKYTVEHKKLKKSKKKRQGKKYKSGDLGKAIFELFSRVGVGKVTFEQALKVAKKAKPNTTYGKSYFSWHKNHYRNTYDL